MSAGGAICSYLGGIALAAWSRAASVWDWLTNRVGLAARISVCATCPTSGATWPGTTLSVRIAVSAAASSSVTMIARAKGPRPSRVSPPASVRGMNMDKWRLAAAALREQPANELTQGAAIGAALDLGHEAAHDATHLGRRGSSGLRNGGSGHALQLCGIELLGQELGEDRDLALFLGRPVAATRSAIDLDALAPLLDLAAEDLADLLIGQVTAQLDASAVSSSHGHA